MAYLRPKKTSKNYHCCFRLPGETKHTERSTGTDDKNLANMICSLWDKTAREAEKGSLIKKKSYKILDMITGFNVSEEKFLTFGEYSKRWLRYQQGRVAERTYEKYESTVRNLGEILDKKQLLSISKSDIISVKEKFLKTYGATSVKQYLKLLRAILEKAKEDEIIDKNIIGRDLTEIKKHQHFEKRTFSPEQMKKIFQVCSQPSSRFHYKEMYGLVLFGLFTGQGIGDVRRLKRNQIDFEKEVIYFIRQKTGKVIIAPLIQQQKAYVLELKKKEDEYLFEKYSQVRTAFVSKHFNCCLEEAGIKKLRSYKKRVHEDPTIKKRQASLLSFHSLRHTFNSELKKAGVSEAVAKDLLGHGSTSVNLLYTHIDIDSKRDAVDKFERNFVRDKIFNLDHPD